MLRPPLALALALLLLAMTACEQMPRSAYRKFAVYEPQRLQSLDIASMRLALRHDARTPLQLESTYLAYFGGYEGGIHELCRFVPLLVVQSAAVPGLPPAGKVMTWTVLAVSGHDAALASVATRLSWTAIALQNPKKKPDSERKALEEERFFSELVSVFPQFAFAGGSRFTGQTWDYGFYGKTSYRFADSPSVPRDRFPLDVWVLVDPKDGYFQIVKGPVSLDQSTGSEGKR